MKEIYQTAQYQTADVVILGSSRAHHHYVPSVFFDSLGITAHNGGVDGNGIVMAKGLYQMITERYHPSLLIYDVISGFDFFVNSEDGNNIRYLGNLRPYSRKPSLRNLMDRIDPME